MAHVFEYWRWTRQLPAVAAATAIVDDLGLLALVSGFPGRSGEALAAAPELNATAEDALSLPAVVRLLEGAVGDRDLGAGSRVPGHAVRVLNVHQAKGLEAPVVFLAAPVKMQDRRPALHVDRRGPEPLGHFLVAELDDYGEVRRVLTQPPQGS